MTHQQHLGEYAQFVKPHWTTEELEKFEVVVGFLQALKSGDLNRINSDYGDHPYVQHNPTMENGMEGVLSEAKGMAAQFPNFFIDTKHVYLDGDFVIIQAHFAPFKEHRGDDTKGVNAIDVWKVVDGKIMEHWDALQPLNGSERKNNNGIF